MVMLNLANAVAAALLAGILSTAASAQETRWRFRLLSDDAGPVLERAAEFGSPVTVVLGCDGRLSRVVFRFADDAIPQGPLVFRYRIDNRRATMIAAQGLGKEVTFQTPFSLLLLDEMLRAQRITITLGGLFDAPIGEAEFHLSGLKEMLRVPDARCGR